jgi:hypothetical protein
MNMAAANAFATVHIDVSSRFRRSGKHRLP